MGNARGGRRIRSRRKSGRLLRRLAFEPLEDRRLLAVLTVNSLADNVLAADGFVTLREAVFAANTDTTTDLMHTGNGADVIQFDPALFTLGPGTVLLNMGELAISKSLTIDASGLPNGVTIDATGNDPTPTSTLDDGNALNDGDGSRVFRVDDLDGGMDIDVAFDSIVIRGGDTPVDGGGILNRENLTLLDSKITGNIAVRGGGIYTRNGSLTLTRSAVEENSSRAYGGGLVVRETELLVSDSAITGNSAVTYGGGIDIVSDATSEIVRSTISYNQLRSATGSGGGLYARTPNGRITITDSTISGNFGGRGGGMYVEAGSTGAITITNSTVSGNSSAGYAGGVAVVSDGTVEIVHVTITNNTSDSDFSGQGSGGGVFHTGNGTLNVSHTIIAGNTDNTGAAAGYRYYYRSAGDAEF